MTGLVDRGCQCATASPQAVTTGTAEAEITRAGWVDASGAPIDVITTLNIQHIESLNDVVAGFKEAHQAREGSKSRRKGVGVMSVFQSC